MSRRPGQPPLIPALALAHLRHDWILTLCLVIALAAVIAPLLVLLGLKEGTVATLRERLVEDPVFREIKPTQTQEYSDAWLAELATWPGVAFLTPTILPLSSVLQVSLPDSRETELIDLIPTAPGDPLLLENGVPVPGAEELVLSGEPARLLDNGAGATLEARVSRSRAGRTESVTASGRVIGILPAAAGNPARIYAPLDLVLDVEAFKEGYAAPRRGWPGTTPEPYLSFDGAVLLVAEALSPIVRTGAIINTGFARITPISSAQASARLGIPLPDQLTAYDLGAPNTTITFSSIQAIKPKLRGYQHALLPYVEGLDLRDAAGQPLTLAGLSLNATEAALLELPTPPWGGLRDSRGDARSLTQVLLPASRAATPEAPLAIRSAGVAPLELRLRPVGRGTSAQPLVPIELLAVLRTARERAVTYDPDSERFALKRGGFRGFRLYAASIDAVPALYRRLRAAGIEVIAEVAAIERIQVLDRGLGQLFWLVAGLGISGGTAVLIASLYAAVDRLRRELGILRLLGLTRHQVAGFPVVEGLLIALLGLLTGLAGYAALAFAINQTFASELAPGERFCALPAAQLPLIALVTLLLALLASLIAAWRATQIDPAEAVRED